MRPDQHARLLRLTAQLAALLERQRRLIAESELVLKEAERRLRPEHSR